MYSYGKAVSTAANIIKMFKAHGWKRENNLNCPSEGVRTSGQQASKQIQAEFQDQGTTADSLTTHHVTLK